jgi:5-methylcytosine-specific restriction endonuclease McrA
MNRCAIPEWVKRVIRHRDKGRCVFCGKDVVGIYETQDSRLEQFDHIVPLNEHGINDFTNMQLTCYGCNREKLTNSMTNNVYVNWYDRNEQ